MLCAQLIYLLGTEHNRDRNQLLRHGSTFSEPTRSELHGWELDRMHEGKESSITHMLSGGNGFPTPNYQTYMAKAQAELGQTIERRDLRSLHAWQSSLDNCRRDMYRRFEI